MKFLVKELVYNSAQRIQSYADQKWYAYKLKVNTLSPNFVEFDRTSKRP